MSKPKEPLVPWVYENNSALKAGQKLSDALIAAAPDLLEAVKWCVSIFGNEPAHGPGQRMTMAEYKALNAIIAKAEGRT